MKNAHLVALASICLACAAPARAQVFGQFTGAAPLPVNSRMFGAYVHSSENVVGLLAQLRLSFYPGVDFGFQGGLARQDRVGGNTTTVRLGADAKVGVTKATEQAPFAIAVGGNIGVETGDDFNLLTLGPTVVASRDFPLGETGGLTPYVRAGLAISNIDVGPVSDTDLSMPLRIGSEFRFAAQMSAVFEIQLQIGDDFSDDVAIAGGVNFPF